MQVIRVTTDLTVPDIEEAKDFYGDYLGLDAQDMGLDWVTRFVVQPTLTTERRSAHKKVGRSAACRGGY